MHRPARHRFVIAMERTRHRRLGTARVRAGPLLFCCLLPFIFCALANPARSAPPEPRAVTVGILNSFPPYYELDENGRPGGFAVEVMNEVAERAGITVKYAIFKTGKATQEALKEGRVDVIPGLGITESRKRVFAFTAPVQTLRISFFIRNNTRDVGGMADFAGRTVAVVASNAAQQLLERHDEILLKVFPDVTAALFALLAGHVDGLAYPEPMVWKLAKEAQVADRVRVVGDPLIEIKSAMAVRKDNVELLALLDLAVGEFVASPDYRRIYVAWFGEPSPFWTPIRAALAMGVLFALSLIAMAGWRYRFVTKLNSQLERRVQERTVELRSAVAALRESEARFRDLAESASDWFWEIGHDLRVTYISDRIREVAGVEPSSVIGVHVRDLPTVNHEDSDWNAYMDALEERRPFRGLICQRPVDDGSIRSFQVSGRPVFDNKGEFLGFRGATTDVTARVRAEEALRQARDELEQRVAQRTAELREANEQLKMEIAERKLAEQALRESEERYKRLVETTNVIPWEADLSTWRFTYVGPQAVSLLGYALDDWYGAGFWPNAIHPDDRDEAVAFRQATSARGEDHDVEYRMLTADGDVVWMRDVVTVVSDEHGPKALRGIMIDITEQKQAQVALYEREAQFRAIMDSAPVEIYLKDREGRYVRINRRYEELWGVKDEEVRGKLPGDIHHQENFVTSTRAHDLAVLQSGRTIEQEDDVLFEDGVHTLHMIKFPIRDSDGNISGLGAIATDVTERKRAQEALHRSEERLQRSVLDAPIPIMMHAEGGEVLMISKRWSELSGYSHADIPTIHDWTEKAYDANKERVRDRIRRLCEIEEPFEHEASVTTARGERRIWDFRTAPLGRLPDGRRFVISMAVDVTERRMAHDELERRVEERTAELRAAQADLLRQERLATLGQLTATVSHELRNPLGVIRTSNFIVRDGLNEITPRVQRALERIDRSVIRCDRIIDELLDFTRISGLEPEPTPIDAWLDLTLKEQALPAEITLRRDFGLAGTTVPFDRDRFRRAIINVFDNACQAMTGEVGREATDADNAVLSVKTQRKNGRVEVIFEDRGPGIPADVLPRIFEPLFSTKGFGVGLGLPVVKRIMEQHGGGIEIDRAGTSGTRVCLWLPAERPTRPRT